VRTSRQGRANRARKVRVAFDDGTELETSRDVLVALGLPPDGGDTPHPASARPSISEVEPECARLRALRLVTHRERSRQELARRMDQDGYPSAVVEPLIAHLTDLGLLDDMRFAGVFARSRVSSGWGRSRIQRALCQEYAVDADTVAEALAEACPLDDEDARALELIGSRALATPKDRDRVLRLLIRRGFTYSQARSAIDASTRARSES